MLEQGGGRTDQVAAPGRSSDGALTGAVERLPGVGGWYVVRVDPDRSRLLRPGAAWGFVPVTASVGRSTWDTSLMPRGDGSLFLALPAAVRRAEDVDEGDQVRAFVRPRQRTTTYRRGRW